VQGHEPVEGREIDTGLPFLCGYAGLQGLLCAVGHDLSSNASARAPANKVAPTDERVKARGYKLD
jgi:hypothetical protein